LLDGRVEPARSRRSIVWIDEHTDHKDLYTTPILDEIDPQIFEDGYDCNEVVESTVHMTAHEQMAQERSVMERTTETVHQQTDTATLESITSQNTVKNRTSQLGSPPIGKSPPPPRKKTSLPSAETLKRNAEINETSVRMAAYLESVDLIPM